MIEKSIKIDSTNLYLIKPPKSILKRSGIPISHNPHSTINDKLQKHTHLKEKLIKLWQLVTTTIILCYPQRVISKINYAKLENCLIFAPLYTFHYRKQYYLLSALYLENVGQNSQ